jgi:hypothetical protein
MSCYPEIEAVLWRTVQKAIVGELGTEAALHSIVDQVTQILETNQH